MASRVAVACGDTLRRCTGIGRATWYGPALVEVVCKIACAWARALDRSPTPAPTALWLSVRSGAVRGPTGRIGGNVRRHGRIYRQTFIATSPKGAFAEFYD